MTKALSRWRALLVISVLVAPPCACACDVCAIYTATEQRESRTGVWAGMAEQYTYFRTWQQNSQEVPNPGERLNSFITQFLVGYTFTPRFGVQLALPFIAREFRRQEEQGIFVDGNVTGFGDMSLLATLVGFSDVTEQSVSHFALFGGLKLPTGNPQRLSEELPEDPQSFAAHLPHRSDQASSLASPARASRGFAPYHTAGGKPFAVQSGIHGHDLALGSGSTDGIVGTQLFISYQRLFFTAAEQYALRTPGSFDYTYANDFVWNGGPGAYLLLSHDYSLGFQAVISGETKGNDTFMGVNTNDTAITSLFLGPGLRFTWGTSLAAEIDGDLPAVENNTGLQIVPDYRVRAGMTWHF